MGHTQAGLHGLRESQRREIVALGFHHETNDLATMDVQRAPLDQPSVHSGVEPAVVDDVVDVAVDVVVAPARADGAEDAVVVPGLGLGARGGDR
ncbi:hypothetical protein D9M68_776050 [compost metagenome]